MLTTVVNKRNGPHVNATYIGRPSIWGNPFVVGRDGTRAEVINKYRTWIQSNAPEARYIRENIHQLKGKRLVCYCSPLACHGDVLAELAEAS